MATVTFDTLKFVDTLRDSGMDEKQAKAISEAVKQAHETAEVATKRDLQELELRMIIKLGALMVAGISIVATLVKLL